MDKFTAWLEKTLGHKPANPVLFERAVTHPSRGEDNYQRLEFLGDRVLALAVAAWLLEVYPAESEGEISHRLTVLVSGEVCAEIARELGVSPHLRLGRQAIDDGVHNSDNVLGDVVEALIAALYLDAGLNAATRFIRAAWSDRIDRLSAPPRHPKALLQEWTAARKRRAPEYRLVDAAGPDHARRFTVLVSIGGVGEARGIGSSKREAEAEAARALLEKLG